MYSVYFFLSLSQPMGVIGMLHLFQHNSLVGVETCQLKWKYCWDYVFTDFKMYHILKGNKKTTRSTWRLTLEIITIIQISYGCHLWIEFAQLSYRAEEVFILRSDTYFMFHIHIQYICLLLWLCIPPSYQFFIIQQRMFHTS